MNRLLLILLLTPTLSFGQITLNVIKISEDSVKIFLDDGITLKMGETYQLTVKTNIIPTDSLALNAKADTFLYNGMTFNFISEYHQYGFYVKRRNTIIGNQQVINLLGTKYRVKIDNRIIDRYHPNRITSKSIIEIELISDTEDIKELKIKNPVLVYWTKDKRTVRQFRLENNKVRVDFSKEKDLKKNYNPDLEMNFLVLHLPQAYDKNDKGVMATEEKQRTFLLGYD